MNKIFQHDKELFYIVTVTMIKVIIKLKLPMVVAVTS